MTDHLHKVTHSEIAQVRRLGFIIDHTSSKSPEDFLNDFFPGIKFQEFLYEIDNLLGPQASDSLSKAVNMNDAEPALLLIEYYSKDKELFFSRFFTKYQDGIVVDHEFFSLPRAIRRQGLAKRVLASSLKQYLNMAVSKIRVHAALEDGGYVWARVGFKAVNRAEIQEILSRAKKSLNPSDFNIVEKLYNGYYDAEPNGQAFPIQDWARLACMQAILRGSTWHGEIDLTNEIELRNFSHYVNEQSKI